MRSGRRALRRVSYSEFPLLSNLLNRPLQELVVGGAAALNFTHVLLEHLAGLALDIHFLGQVVGNDLTDNRNDLLLLSIEFELGIGRKRAIDDAGEPVYFLRFEPQGSAPGLKWLSA